MRENQLKMYKMKLKNTSMKKTPTQKPQEEQILSTLVGTDLLVAKEILRKGKPLTKETWLEEIYLAEQVPQQIHPEVLATIPEGLH